LREDLKEIIEDLDAKKYVGEIKQLSCLLSESFFSGQASVTDKRTHFAKRVHDILFYCIKTEEDMRVQQKAILVMCTHNSEIFPLATDALKNNPAFALEAVKRNRAIYPLIPPALQTREMSLDVFKHKGWGYHDIPNEFKEDREFVLHAVSVNGALIANLSERFRSDREIVLAAVANDGLALQYASQRLQNDKEVVLKALCQTTFALQFTSPQLRDDEEIMLMVLKKYPALVSIHYYNPTYRNYTTSRIIGIADKWKKNEGRALKQAALKEIYRRKIKRFTA
jgi:hypothetical protein